MKLALLVAASVASLVVFARGDPPTCVASLQDCTETKCCEEYGYTCKQKDAGYSQCRPMLEMCPPGDGSDWTCVDQERTLDGPRLETVEFALLYDDRFPDKKGELYMKTPLYQNRHQVMYQQNEVSDFTFLATASADTTSVLFEFLDWERLTISSVDGRSPNGDQSRPYSAFGKTVTTLAAGEPKAKYMGAPDWIKELEGCGGGYTLRATPYNAVGDPGVPKYFSVKILPDCGCIDFEPLLKGLELVVLDEDNKPVAPPAGARRQLAGLKVLPDTPDDSKTSLRKMQMTNAYGEVLTGDANTMLMHGFTYVLDTNQAWPGKKFTFKASECGTLSVETISKVEWRVMDMHRTVIPTEGVGGQAGTGFDESSPYTLFGDEKGETYTPLPDWMINGGGTFFIRALPWDPEGKAGPEDTAQDIKIYIVAPGAAPPQTVKHHRPEVVHTVEGDAETETQETADTGN
ncbi:unnamed protein product [Vitrella brassicaformis CCMP3155]|uniref:Uncharacterized protein n=2 Tax=Vitrella brassicaformis TaxID=1169539 RepID=A0A0G4EX64_VITBC|nr:unnamed protein product [Vitrella brassicaformis CCMP3155]|eukprot:CEM02684.1 unnamed protein product [Vitrella brassicaformis CCMP3155]